MWEPATAAAAAASRRATRRHLRMACGGGCSAGEASVPPPCAAHVAAVPAAPPAAPALAGHAALQGRGGGAFVTTAVSQIFIVRQSGSGRGQNVRVAGWCDTRMRAGHWQEHGSADRAAGYHLCTCTHAYTRSCHSSLAGVWAGKPMPCLPNAVAPRVCGESPAATNFGTPALPLLATTLDLDCVLIAKS